MTLPLVLLPGMMCDARLYTPQIAALSAERPIILPLITQFETMDDLAADVLRIAPAEFALAGLSMGGIVAMEILRQAPGRVRKIALLDTNHLSELDEVKARRIPQIERVRNGELAAIMRDEMKPNYLSDGPKKSTILDLCMTMALDLGPDVFIRQSKALATRSDQSKVLTNTAVPALVICGRQDMLCPVERHKQMAGLLPNATLQIIENAGHMPPLEQPDEINIALKRWLKR